MIKEVIIDPTPVYVGQKFKVKIKSEITWEELATMSFNDLLGYTWQDIKRGA